MYSTTPRRRWTQFNTRTLFLLITAAAVFCGWQANRARRQREVLAAIKAAGGGAAYAHQDTLPGGYSSDPPPVPAWLRRVIGDEYFQEVVFVNLMEAKISDELLQQVARLSTIRELMLGNAQLKDAHLRYIAQLPNLRWITFNVRAGETDPCITAAGIRYLAACQSIEQLDFNPDCPVSDAGLAYLGQLRNLRELTFHDREVTDAGIKSLQQLRRLEDLSIMESSMTDRGLGYLESLPSLKKLALQDAQISDEGMKSIGRCRKLEEVLLIGHAITDEGLRHLKGLKNAKEITICSRPVTNAGVAELQQALPGCRVVKW